MKSFLLVLMASLSLVCTACSRLGQPAAVNHPTDKETQDFKDGEAMAEDKYGTMEGQHSDVQAMTGFDDNFGDAGALINHSTYFDIGAYYKEYKNISNWNEAYQKVYQGHADDTELKLAQTGVQVAWARLSDDFKKSGITYDQFSKLIGESAPDAQALVETSPDSQ